MQFRRLGLVALGLVLTAPASAQDARDSGPDWQQILTSKPQGSWPEPQAGDVVWRDDMRAALKEAEQSGRPLFVTFRCLPCKQCSDFDKEVLEGGPELDPLLKRFITVRLTNARLIDFRLFPVEGFQDLDCSWWGYFMAPDARLYGVFGGKDHVSDTTRISARALVTALERVLTHHSDPRRAGWDVDGEAPKLRGKPRGPEKLEGWRSWARQNPGAFKENQACLHCHTVKDVLRQPAVDKGKFDKHHDQWVWPLPENVGLTVARDHGLKITKVERGSAAAEAGLEPGDVLAVAGGRRLFSQTDFRGALHRAPKAGQLELRWLRGGELQQASLSLAPGWRETVIWWRASASGGNFGGHPSFWPLKAQGGAKPWFGKQPSGAAWDAGLRGNDVITAVNGEAVGQRFGREFMTWFRLKFEGGDPVTLTVRRGGQERTVRYRAKGPGY